VGQKKRRCLFPEDQTLLIWRKKNQKRKPSRVVVFKKIRRPPIVNNKKEERIEKRGDPRPPRELKGGSGPEKTLIQDFGLKSRGKHPGEKKGSHGGKTPS